MKPLSKEATDALKALAVGEPTAADEARVRAGVQRALGVGLPAAALVSATTAQAAAGASVFAVGAKVLVFVAAVGVGSWGTFTLKASFNAPATVPARAALNAPGHAELGRALGPTDRVEPHAPATSPALAELGRPAAPAALQPAVGAAVGQVGTLPGPAEVVAATLAQAPERTTTRASPSAIGAGPGGSALSPPTVDAELPVADEAPLTPPPPPAAAPTLEQYEQTVEVEFATCDAATERRSAQSARQLLNLERPQEAVWLLGAYQRRCASGRWSDDAWAVRIAGLCRLGRTAEVVGLLQWFSTEYPERRASLLADVRSSCPEAVLRRAAADQ